MNIREVVKEIESGNNKIDELLSSVIHSINEYKEEFENINSKIEEAKDLLGKSENPRLIELKENELSQYDSLKNELRIKIEEGVSLARELEVRKIRNRIGHTDSFFKKTKHSIRNVLKYSSYDFINQHSIDSNFFSDEEKGLVDLKLSEFKEGLIIKLKLSPNQIQDLEVRIDYLSESKNRLSKREWKGIAISTLLSIITSLSLDTKKGEFVWNLFLEIFSSGLKLIGN